MTRVSDLREDVAQDRSPVGAALDGYGSLRQLVERKHGAEVGLDLAQRVVVEVEARARDAVTEHDHVEIAVVRVPDRRLDAELRVAARDEHLLDAEHPQL